MCGLWLRGWGLRSSVSGLQFRGATPESKKGSPKVNFPSRQWFSKWRAPILALLNEFTPSNTLAWWGFTRVEPCCVREQGDCRACCPRLVIRFGHVNPRIMGIQNLPSPSKARLRTFYGSRDPYNLRALKYPKSTEGLEVDRGTSGGRMGSNPPARPRIASSLMRRGCDVHRPCGGLEPSGFIFVNVVYLVIDDSGKVSLEHLLLSWYPVEPINPESII